MKPFEFVITVDVNKEDGDNQRRDDIAAALQQELEGCDPGEIDVEGTSYGTTRWEVNELVKTLA